MATKWHYLGWEPPWRCEKGYFFFAQDVEYGFRHVFLFGTHWIKPDGLGSK